jgi:hypothetical protein
MVALQFLMILIPDFSSRRAILGSTFMVVKATSALKLGGGNLMKESKGRTDIYIDGGCLSPASRKSSISTTLLRTDPYSRVTLPPSMLILVRSIKGGS